MDANKLQKLLEINYTIKPTCALCKHSDFRNDDWGICNAYEYEHLKHTEENRKLSINVNGCCPNFKHSQEKIQKLNHFVTFFNK